MAERTFHVSILPHWRKSQDVLLKALVANGGDLRSALQQVEGILDDECSDQIRLDLQYTRITDEGMEALASQFWSLLIKMQNALRKKRQPPEGAHTTSELD